jgi:hypothetical protein
MTLTRLKAVLVLVAAVAFAASPFFTPDFGGYDPDQFPLRIEQPAILPAGYAFSIWGLIYAWLVLHAVFGLWRRADDPAWDAMRTPLIGSLGIGAIWLWVAVQSPVVASVLIAIMLERALAALFRTPATPDRWLLLAPVAIYAGWLTAATGVSVGILLAGYGWLSDTRAALVMLFAALGLAALVQQRLGRAPEYGATVIWALVAVIVANGTGNLPVSGLAVVGIVGMAVVAAGAWRLEPGARR